MYIAFVDSRHDSLLRGWKKFSKELAGFGFTEADVTWGRTVVPFFRVELDQGVFVEFGWLYGFVFDQCQRVVGI